MFSTLDDRDVERLLEGRPSADADLAPLVELVGVLRRSAAAEPAPAMGAALRAQLRATPVVPLTVAQVGRGALFKAGVAAAAFAVVGLGVGATQNVLPSGLQDVLSSTAGVVGIELPEASERHDGGSNGGGTSRSERSNGNDDGEPGGGNTNNDNGGGATPADPGTPGDQSPATPAVPPANSNGTPGTNNGTGGDDNSGTSGDNNGTGGDNGTGGVTPTTPETPTVTPEPTTGGSDEGEDQGGEDDGGAQPGRGTGRDNRRASESGLVNGTGNSTTVEEAAGPTTSGPGQSGPPVHATAKGHSKPIVLDESVEVAADVEDVEDAG